MRFELFSTFLLTTFVGCNSNVVKMDIYMESKCSDTIRFIKKSFYPVYKNLTSSLQVQFIPYGNAKETKIGDDWKFQCQHGPKECVGNIMEACFLHYVVDNRKQVDFIHCVETSEAPEESGEKCLKEIRMSQKWARIDECRNSKMGRNLEHEMGIKTNSLSPKHTFIPWILLNGKSVSYSVAVNPVTFKEAIEKLL
ncbi:MFAP1 (predicted) [Pycnogonum litorale]